MGLEQGLLEQVQAASLIVPVRRQMGAVVVMDLDFLVLLTLVGVLFSPAGADCLLYLRLEEIWDVAPNRLRVVLQHLNNE